MGKSAVFIDLQGTLGDPPFGDVTELKLYPFSAKAIKLLNDNHILAIIITDQSHISKGEITQDEYTKSMKEVLAQLSNDDGIIDDVYCCPHTLADKCTCKKPQTELPNKAKEKYNIDFKKSYIIGDLGGSDMVMGENIGAKKVLVKTGGGIGSLKGYKYLWKDVKEDYIADNILDGVKWIIKDLKNRKKKIKEK